MKKDKNKPSTPILSYVFLIIGCIGCCFIFKAAMDAALKDETDLGKELIKSGVLLLLMYVAIIFHLIVHEAGHLVFGLMSGYKFSSFRVFSLMILKENGRFRLRKLSIAGTGGQCLMSPPDTNGGKVPVVLFNLGGSILNAIFSAVFACIYFPLQGYGMLSAVMLVFCVVGIITALFNGIPIRTSIIDNDGYNTLSLRRNENAMRAFCIQLKVNELTASGVRLRDMPKEWFELPRDEDMKNSLVATVAVFAANRLMDEHRFSEADELMEKLLASSYAINGLYRVLITCDRLYCEMITLNRSEVISAMLTQEQKKIMEKMKAFPTVIRVDYTYMLLQLKKQDNARKCKELFENIAKRYPYPTDICSERELMDIAEQTFILSQSEPR